MSNTDTEVMNRYTVKVTVDFMYEVEATSEEAAEKEGWYWENYPMFGEVYDISVELDEEDIYGEDDEDED